MVLIRNVSPFLANRFKNTFLFFCTLFISCGNGTKILSQDKEEPISIETAVQNKADLTPPLLVAANQTALYLPLLKDKKVGIVGNQTSVIFKYPNVTSLLQKDDGVKNTGISSYTHLVDSLLLRGVAIEKVFAPEHGFRGKADAAEFVADGKDTKTGYPSSHCMAKTKSPQANL